MILYEMDSFISALIMSAYSDVHLSNLCWYVIQCVIDLASVSHEWEEIQQAKMQYYT